MNTRTIGVGAIVVTALLWGTTGTAATFAPAVGPLAIGAVSLGLGGILQAVIAVPALRRARRALRRRWQIVALGAIAVAIYPLAFYSSMHLAGVAIGSVVSLASAPLASGVLERVIDRTTLSRPWMVAAALGVVGSALLCLSKLDAHSGALTSTLAGLVLGLIAGITYAGYSWAAHRLMHDGLGRSASMGAVFGGGGALLLPVLFLTGGPLLATREAFATGAYMALVPMFLGYLLFGYGLSQVSASTATTLTLIEAAVAAILAVVIVGEHLTITGWVGLGLIGGVLVILAAAPTTTPQSRAGESIATEGRKSRPRSLDRNGLSSNVR
ncbi:EamA/RhaT family transporter [Curtobacterium sp. MCBD17_034]|uniref:EamA family transporter n=1 Tax=unclassified Curtobacterium TaxID=257496 RepID=UPI000DA963DD|nr:MULTISPECIES: EamA family transporter [unclassified Curtobacterium]PZF62141.1 EamA/RhaT family transporter [Curtobacterium sp. MCBD17_034]PZM33924.1 EamA/RhaT family transporter [Curtobacterium sp. MCBD17_031]